MLGLDHRHGYHPSREIELTRRVFHDNHLQQAFDERGWVCVPFLAPNEVAALVDFYNTEASQPGGLNPPGAFNDTYAEFSVMHSRPEFRRRAFDMVCATLSPHSTHYLDGYRPLFANFINKFPGTGVVPLHQNFSVVDERRFQSVSVWVALVDCELENGAMLVADRSHRHLRSWRGMWSYQTFGAIPDEAAMVSLKPITVRAGDAVILDDALLHYSPPNMTNVPRLAIQFVMLPSEAQALWCVASDATEAPGYDVTIYEVTPDYFTTIWGGVGDNEGLCAVERLHLESASISPVELDALSVD